MKLALIALPVVALTTMSVAQAQILSITNAGKTSQVIVREDDGEDYYLPSDAVNAAIKNLSQQTQQKEDRLASLAQKLSTQPTTIINMPAMGSYAGNGMLALRPITSSARMSSGFGYRIHPVTGKSQFHKGMDFAAPIGTPIYATGNGVVTFSGWGTGYGRYVEVDHGNGTVTRYAHTSANYVNVGDTVYANQQIAAVGAGHIGAVLQNALAVLQAVYGIGFVLGGVSGCAEQPLGINPTGQIPCAPGGGGDKIIPAGIFAAAGLVQVVILHHAAQHGVHALFLLGGCAQAVHKAAVDQHRTAHGKKRGDDQQHGADKFLRKFHRKTRK